MSDEMTARCPDCGRVGFDDCKLAACKWDQWDDGTRVTPKQRADGAAFADAINRQIAERNWKEREYWRESCRIIAAELKEPAP